MTTQEVINCAPWRLAQPRPLTPYEWTVAENAVHGSILTGGKVPSIASRQAARALTMAVSQQRACPSWTHSAFGPAPAVATYAYGCLGSWWGALDPVSQTRALAELATGLLCAPQVPWENCPRAQQDLSWRPLSRSEYGAQRGTPPRPGALPANSCELVRRGTVYTPLTGKELNDLMHALGDGVVPPEFAKIVHTGGHLFANTSFLIGWQLRRNPDLGKLQALSTPQDLMRMLDETLEEVVVVSAPGKGVSIRQMIVTGTVDPAKLILILQQINPSAWGDLIQQLPSLLPGLLQQLPPLPFDLGGILGALGGANVQHKLVKSAQMPNDTGYSVIDKPGDEQDDSATDLWSQAAADYETAAMWYLGIAVILVGAFAYDAYRRKKG